jgi:hypothetical protein
VRGLEVDPSASALRARSLEQIATPKSPVRGLPVQTRT